LAIEKSVGATDKAWLGLQLEKDGVIMVQREVPALLPERSVTGWVGSYTQLLAM
jgi:hypothetical protein